LHLPLREYLKQKRLDEEKLMRQLDALNVNVDAEINSSQEIFSDVFGKCEQLRFADNSQIDILIDHGVIRNFSGSWEDVPEHLTIADAISEESAWETVTRFIQTGRYDIETDKLCAEFRDQGDLKSSSWHFSGALFQRGAWFFGSDLTIEVSAYSGKIIFMMYEPLVHAPEAISNPIPFCDALETYCTNESNQQEVPCAKVRPEIVVALVSDDDAKQDAAHKPVARYAYLVSCYHYQEVDAIPKYDRRSMANRYFSRLVDIETGQELRPWFDFDPFF